MLENTNNIGVTEVSRVRRKIGKQLHIHLLAWPQCLKSLNDIQKEHFKPWACPLSPLQSLSILAQ